MFKVQVQKVYFAPQVRFLRDEFNIICVTSPYEVAEFIEGAENSGCRVYFLRIKLEKIPVRV